MGSLYVCSGCKSLNCGSQGARGNKADERGSSWLRSGLVGPNHIEENPILEEVQLGTEQQLLFFRLTYQFSLLEIEYIQNPMKET